MENEINDLRFEMNESHKVISNSNFYFVKNSRDIKYLNTKNTKKMTCGFTSLICFI